MEVLLPPTFDERLIIPDERSLPDGTKCKWLPVDINVSRQYCATTCSTRIFRYLVPDEHIHTLSAQNACNGPYHYSTGKPKRAIYTTVPTHDNRNSYLSVNNSYDDLNRLATITMIRDPFRRLPDAEYCVIQNSDQYSQFMLESYPPTFEEIIVFLNERLSEYNDEPRYKIIRRKVFLIKAFGNSKVESAKFKKLLTVDCNILYNSVNQIFAELNIKIYRCDITQRPKLLGLLYAKLVKNSDEDLIKKVIAAMNLTKK
jgi:hypothetical protein